MRKGGWVFFFQIILSPEEEIQFANEWQALKKKFASKKRKYKGKNGAQVLSVSRMYGKRDGDVEKREQNLGLPLDHGYMSQYGSVYLSVKKKYLS